MSFNARWWCPSSIKALDRRNMVFNSIFSASSFSNVRMNKKRKFTSNSFPTVYTNSCIDIHKGTVSVKSSLTKNSSCQSGPGCSKLS